MKAEVVCSGGEESTATAIVMVTGWVLMRVNPLWLTGSAEKAPARPVWQPLGSGCRSSPRTDRHLADLRGPR